ncbi:unnamed protein product [Rotaria sordida]|uniref:ALMS motif domain-containing protein n=1 Tax=Rotaria sordida TaxID=392033 RepID=A0A818II99_9BILA|nr:unnamed protein product [Rotaria sordida]CAF1029970.1 unnamed protein product [Rotaria sordida]CAF3525395.1 unnamed protein product [Rotaria sordida]CAF3551378.1 unnamed protein product [Rotaria sordida]
MSTYVQSARNIGQSPISFSIDALEEIVRNCQRNEERLHELERHTRHERKKAERLLRETYRTMQDGDSQNTSNILENKTNNDHSYIDHQQSKQFFVSLDNENEENENHYCQQSNTNNNNNNNNNKGTVRQNKHLLERVEKLLAGDGTTTSSDIMSSQERQKNIIEKPTSPTEDDLEEKSLNIDHIQKLPDSRQLQSACSIEYDLSTVDHLLPERTPINNHRIKSNVHFNQEDQTKKINDYNNEKKILSDKRDQQFYERYNNYITTNRSVSSRPEKQQTKPDDGTYQYESRPMSRINNKDEELTDLARRCEDLLTRLHSQRNRAVMLENSTHHYDYHRRQTSPRSSTYKSKQHDHHHHHHQPVSPSPPPEAAPSMSLQQALELLRPEFISRSRQRVRRIRLLREERERNAEIDRERRQMLLFSCTNCCSNPPKRAISAPSTRRNISYIAPYDRLDSSQIPSTYYQMKKATKKKYDQLPEVTDRRRQHQMDEIRRRNLLRAKVFRARLRQHVVRHGRTNIDESLTMVDA